MFAGLKRNIRAQHLAHIMAPHSGAVYDRVTGYVTLTAVFPDPVNASDAPPIARNASDGHPFLHLRATLARAFGQCQCNIAGVTLTI